MRQNASTPLATRLLASANILESGRQRCGNTYVRVVSRRDRRTSDSPSPNRISQVRVLVYQASSRSSFLDHSGPEEDCEAFTHSALSSPGKPCGGLVPSNSHAESRSPVPPTAKYQPLAVFRQALQACLSLVTCSSIP